MSFKELFDTNEEKAYWFSALARVGTLASGTIIVTANPYYALLTLVLTALSSEISGYYKLQIQPKNGKSDDTIPQ